MNGGNQSSTVQSMLYVTLCTSCTDYNTHLFSCLISQKTYGPIMIPTTVMKSVPWRNLESALAFCKLQKTTWNWGVISNLPLLSVKHVCLISQKTYGPILIPKNRDVLTCIHLTTAMGDVFHPVVPLSAMKGEPVAYSAYQILMAAILYISNTLLFHAVIPLSAM